MGLGVTALRINPVQGADATTASTGAPSGCQSSNVPVTTSAAGNPARRRRATAASPAPSSIAVTASPRWASGTVA
jgi:hypothetical protein